MKARAASSNGLVGRIFLIAAAAALMLLAILLVQDVSTRRAIPTAPNQVALVLASLDPIAAEADVFRSSFIDAELNVARRAAHPRTLNTYRALRAYPGAPPRIPHGLTGAELRTTACRTCHERGGYAQRFGAYAPVTPHPEQTECLQCHLGEDALMGGTPAFDVPNALCRQCHAARGATPPHVPVDWRPAPWPVRERPTADGAPPPITHELQLRGNCIACHAGPAAVAELRTSHPERASCLQCHVQAAVDVEPFARQTAGGER